MSRTTKDAVRQRPEAHRDAPFWRFGHWLKHGHKRSSAALRRLQNRRRRAAARAVLYAGGDPAPDRRDMGWVYW